MRIAKEIAECHGISVNLYTAQYECDRPFVPLDFQSTPELERSVIDVRPFKVSRRLPFIQDILDRLYAADATADYLIYTNVDIALMPNFYRTVEQLVQAGHDAFVINRRTISKNYSDPADLLLMYSQVGKPHLGHDCFVFRRSAYPHYRLEQVCIGATLIGMAMLVNLICNSENFKEFRHLHLTFHLGDDTAWRSPDLDDYTSHNLHEVEKIVSHYKEKQRLVSHPLIQRFLRNPTIDYWSGRQDASKFRLLKKVRSHLRSKLKYLFP